MQERPCRRPWEGLGPTPRSSIHAGHVSPQEPVFRFEVITVYRDATPTVPCSFLSHFWVTPTSSLVPEAARTHRDRAAGWVEGTGLRGAAGENSIQYRTS